MKARLCFVLSVCILLVTLALPVAAGDPPALQIEQAQPCEPGQSVTLSISIPTVTLAGGFISLQYDRSLFFLTDVSLAAANDILTLTYADQGGDIRILLDGAQNAEVSGQLITLTFATIEEIQPGSYPVTCTVPDDASFYALLEDGSTTPLYVSGCQGQITVSQPTLPPCPARYLACQETDPADGNVRVRICAVLDEQFTPAKDSYGFCYAIEQNGNVQELTVGGSDITDTLDGGGYTYTAAELGGRIFTATLTVPASGEVRITVTPYVVTEQQTLYAGSYTLVYIDGIYSHTLQ